MASDANLGPSAADEDRFAEISVALADAVEAVLPGWIERLVTERALQWRGAVTAEVRSTAVQAGQAAVTDVTPTFRAFLQLDIDRQRSNPLAILREATRFAHDALAELGVPPVERDEFAQRSFPDDRYGLVPATWDDVDPSLHDLGITWGAAKAYLHKARRRAEDRS